MYLIVYSVQHLHCLAELHTVGLNAVWVYCESCEHLQRPDGRRAALYKIRGEQVRDEDSELTELSCSLFQPFLG